MISKQVNDWAKRHNVSDYALEDLIRTLVPEIKPFRGKPGSEAFVSSMLMLEASKKDVMLLRNNNGAFFNDTGRLIRFGLGHESAETNARIKSSDFIGIRRVDITLDMVGTSIGQFVAREAKKTSWTGRTLVDREIPQSDFMLMILLMGGDACFTNGNPTL